MIDNWFASHKDITRLKYSSFDWDNIIPKDPKFMAYANKRIKRDMVLQIIGDNSDNELSKMFLTGALANEIKVIQDFYDYLARHEEILPLGQAGD